MIYLYLILACILLIIVRNIYNTVYNILHSKGKFKIIVPVVNGVLYALLVFLIVFHVNDYQQRKKDYQIYDVHKSQLFCTLTYRTTKEAFHILEVQDPFSTDLIAVNNDGIDIPWMTKYSPIPKIIVYCNEGADWYRKKGFIQVGGHQCYEVDGVVKIVPDYAGLLIVSEMFTFFVIFVLNGICFQIIKEHQKRDQQEEQT